MVKQLYKAEAGKFASGTWRSVVAVHAGPTLTLIKDGDFLCAGFAAVPWTAGARDTALVSFCAILESVPKPVFLPSREGNQEPIAGASADGPTFNGFVEFQGGGARVSLNGEKWDAPAGVEASRALGSFELEVWSALAW